MFNFDLKKSQIYPALIFDRNPIIKWIIFGKKIFLVLFIFFFGYFLFKQNNFSLGLLILFFDLYLISCLQGLFLEKKLKKPRPNFLEENLGGQAQIKPQYNLADFLCFEPAKAVFSLKKNISPTSLFYFLLVQNKKLNFVFARALLNLKEIKKTLKSEIKNFTFSAEDEKHKFQEIISEALKIASQKNRQYIGLGDMLLALAKQEPQFRKILINSNLNYNDIENLLDWQERQEKEISERKNFWSQKNLLKRGTLGKEWAAGYTPSLDKFSIDITKLIKKQGWPEFIGHQKEISATERILVRREINNALIVGRPGIGRKIIYQSLAKKSFLGESILGINYKRVVQLDLPSLIARIENTEEFEYLLDKIFQEVVLAGNIILVIDKFHDYVSGQTGPGTINITGIISPYLSLPQFQIIALTSFIGFHKYIEKNPSILNFFEKITAQEISEKETLIVLENLALILETKYNIFVSYPVLSNVIKFCAKYFGDRPFPEKAIKLLDEVMVYCVKEKRKIIQAKDVVKIVSEKTKIPVGETEIKEREILLNLENLIHQRLINQQEAVKEISSAMRRARAEVTIRKGPIGAFLFLGPTGVGKTETAKTLAKIYFGSEKRMLRFDMSEFQNTSDLANLSELLTVKVRENPFSLVLLDEIEKTHPNILNLFLSVLDEGYLTDSLGRKTSFKETIIIATSNAGYQIILQALREKIAWSEVKEKMLNFLFEKGIFRPEFINRFDAMVVFRPLSKENLLGIADLMLKKLKTILKQKEVEFIITSELKQKIVELSYKPEFGAREMRRVIQDKIENVLAQAILSKQLKRGDRIGIEPEGFRLKIH